MAIVFESRDRKASPKAAIGDTVVPRGGLFAALPLNLLVEDIDEDGSALVTFLGTPIVLERGSYAVVSR